MIWVWIILSVFGFFVLLIILALLNAFRASYACRRKLEKMIEPAVKAVKNDDDNAKNLVMKFAAFPATRNFLYDKLKEMEKTDIFPADFHTEEKVAESDLAKWLMHGNELAAAPTEIELVRKLPVNQEDKNGSIYLFKFRIDPPHWAADKGWMAGVSGPFWDNEELDDFEYGDGTFSEFESFHNMSEEEHIEYLKKALQGFTIRC